MGDLSAGYNEVADRCHAAAGADHEAPAEEDVFDDSEYLPRDADNAPFQGPSHRPDTGFDHSKESYHCRFDARFSRMDW